MTDHTLHLEDIAEASAKLPLDDSARYLLQALKQKGDLALAGDPSVQPYLDAGAIRIVNGVPEFHRDEFIELFAREVLGL